MLITIPPSGMPDDFISIGGSNETKGWQGEREAVDLAAVF
jgi:hypothetical protein